MSRSGASGSTCTGRTVQLGTAPRRNFKHSKNREDGSDSMILDGFDRAGASYNFQNFRVVEKLSARPKTSKNFPKNFEKLRAA